VKYTLLSALPSPKGPVTELQLRDVQTVGDVLISRRASIDPFEQTLHLLARLTGLDFELELSRMDMRDVNKLLDLMETNNKDPRDAADPKESTSA
jgi:hypothetical protein